MSCQNVTKRHPQQKHLPLLYVCSAFATQRISPYPSPSFLFKVPSSVFPHVVRHLVKSTRRSLPISEPKYRLSQKTKQTASEWRARGASTQNTERIVKLLTLSLEWARHVWSQTRYISFYSIFNTFTAYGKTYLQTIEHFKF
jgi:hypothetical protein